MEFTTASASIKVEPSNQSYDKKVIGVVTTNPYMVLGDEREGTVKVAMAGRVPVKVNLEGGPIIPGDYLTTSSVPGEAMKATKAGSVIGKALEACQKSSKGRRSNVY